MSALAATDGGLGDPEADALLDAFTDAAQVLVPFATMYLGPAIAVILKDQDGSTRDPAARDRQILMLALNKLVIEAGTLPAPSTAYAPHTTAFVIDPQTKMGNALDLTFVLGAVRGLTAWAAAGPRREVDASTSADTTTTTARSAATGTTAATRAAPASARELRMAARAGLSASRATATATTTTTSAATTSTATTSSRTTRTSSSGCGCRGGASTSASTTTTTAGCGCNGRTSCTDCIPRGASAADRCSCGTCPTRAAEECETWSASCETRNRLRRCLKDILCELLSCMETALCRDGALDAAALKAWRANLVKCLAGLFCRTLRCLREALCPPAEVCEPLPASIDCLPCSYAVEDPR